MRISIRQTSASHHLREPTAIWDVHIHCLDREMALNPSLCNDTCVGNPLYLLCTNESAPYCGTYEFPQGIEDYRCSSTPATRVSTASFTYIGQENANFVTTTLNVPESVSQSSSTESASVASSSSTITSSTSPPSNTLPPKPPPSSQNNLGAIIGGAVGGFAALSLVLFGIACTKRLERLDNDGAELTKFCLAADLDESTYVTECTE
ncbi:hypothetical protein FGRA07_04964 [Fusarium graminearum]|nr:hypothetical protein FGRA07_04964 [Fusarium graminearum]